MSLRPPPPALIISDIIAPTLRGEGPSLGRRCAVIRFGGCNLACTWCDSPRDWDGSRFNLSAELTSRLVKNIALDALACEPGLVVLTGGEPLIQQNQEGWPILLHLLSGVEIELETNGTIAPTEATVRGVHRFIVSPKLANSGAPAWSRLRPDALQLWAELARRGYAIFNFVVRDATDVETVSSLARLYNIPSTHVYVMVEGTGGDAMLRGTRDLATAVLEAGLNLTTRLGVLIGETVGRALPITTALAR